jgi:hypothetical protein
MVLAMIESVGVIGYTNRELKKGKYIYLRTEANLGIHISASVGGDGGGDLFGRAVLEGVVTGGGGWNELQATAGFICQVDKHVTGHYRVTTSTRHTRSFTCYTSIRSNGYILVTK